MRAILTLLFGVVCLVIGVGIGIFFGPQLKTTEPVQKISSALATTPLASAINKPDNSESAFEEYNYPRIKWRAKPLADAPGGIAQLSTDYDHAGKVMKYKLTMFRAPGKQNCEVQLLDGSGFKIAQFQASDFHAIPGTADIVEARDNFPVGEEQYKQAHDYSIK